MGATNEAPSKAEQRKGANLLDMWVSSAEGTYPLKSDQNAVQFRGHVRSIAANNRKTDIRAWSAG